MAQIGSPTSSHSGYAALKLGPHLSPLLARKFAKLNVEAIRAIQSRILLYAPQFLRSTESWMAELRDEGLTCWICVAPNAKTGRLSLEEGQWVGMYQLHGPLSAAQYNFFDDESLMAECSKDENGGTTTRWTGGRLYVKSQHRNVHTFMALQQASTNFIRETTKQLALSVLTPRELNKGVVTARVQVTAYYGTAAHQAHKANDLRVLREVSRAQDLAYDGLLDAVPAGMLDDGDFTEPMGTLFEMVHFFQ
ncbi:hypothetical protein DM02DRAFT_613100 [Periconia macrospinosa]|uniref:Uncharacterized protein n=1 Tax=Periconia macrospinosa TaxID=97972 RepID=A0A2V1DVB6_9PLEO|nr:hypothetical protein DM02DRAFT_613100 [Periconia macrospinosa]